MRIPGTGIEIFGHRLRSAGDDRMPPALRRHRVPNVVIGAIVLVGMAALVLVIADRNSIFTGIRSGHSVQAQFSRQYLLVANRTQVKVAGVPVGVVTGTRQDPAGALVTMKLYGDNADHLGTAPAAAIRLNAPLLGGKSYVLLTPGGSPGRPRGVIPLSRTTVPVYLDSVLAAITPQAQQGIKQFIDEVNASLANGGQAAFSHLVADAPAALTPTATVVQALEGDQPGNLTQLVTGLEGISATLTAKPGQLESVVSGLDQLASTLGSQSQALSDTVRSLPGELSQAQAGLVALRGTLGQLDVTAGPAMPAVQALGVLVNESQPTLAAAVPLLQELQPLLQQASPAVAQLVPASQTLTSILGDVHGPVINRVLNPLIPDLLGVNHPVDQPPSSLYQEIGYTIEQLDGALSGYDSIGHVIDISIGANQSEVTGAPFSPMVTVGRQPCIGTCPNGVQPPGVQP